MHRYDYESELVADLASQVAGLSLVQGQLCTVLREVPFSTRVVDLVLLGTARRGHFSEALAGLSNSDLLVLAAVCSLQPVVESRLARTLGMANGNRLSNAVRRLMATGAIVRGPHAFRSPIADMVRRSEVIAIEAKLLKHREVLSQAVDNLEIADASYVALPLGYAFNESFLAHCRSSNIGLIVVQPDGSYVLLRRKRKRSGRQSIVRNHFALKVLQEYALFGDRWTSEGDTHGGIQS